MSELLHFCVVLFLFSTAASAIIVLERNSRQRSDKIDRKYFRIIFPERLDDEAVFQFVLNIGALPAGMFGRAGIIFEEWGDAAGIHHRIGVPSRQTGLVDQLRTAVKGVRIVEDEGEPIAEFTSAAEFGMTNKNAPLNIADPAKIATSILTSFSLIGSGEVLLKQMIIMPTNATPPKGGAPSINIPTGRGVTGLILGAAKTGWNMGANIENNRHAEQLKLHQAKFKDPMFSCVIRVGALANSAGRGTQLINRVRDALNASQTSKVQFAPIGLASQKQVLERIKSGKVPSISWPCLFNADELMGIWATPLGSPVIPGLHLGGTRQLPPTPDIQTTGRKLARSNFPGMQDRALAVSRSEAMRHMHVIGKTGVGKSVLLTNLAVQDMESGAGLTVIDPKGDLIADILERIPEHRKDDVILFDPTDRERSIGLNLFAGGSSPSRQAEDIVGMFKKLYTQSWGPRLERTLRAALRTLVEFPDATMLDVMQLLTNDTFRETVLERTRLFEDLRLHWEEYDAMKPAERRQQLDPVLNKLQQLTFRDEVRHIIAQPDPPLKMDQVLSQRKILLVNLAKGELSDETSAFIGSLVMMSLWQAVQRRVSIPADRRVPHYCIVDEFQDFLNMPTSIESMLEQARGYKFSLTLAHQNLAQIKDPKMREAVLANALTRVVFQVSADDAARLAREHPNQLEPADFSGLGKYEVIAQISTDSAIKAPPVTGMTYEPTPATSDPDEIRVNSDTKYTMPRRYVDITITRRRAEFAKRPRVGGRPLGT